MPNVFRPNPNLERDLSADDEFQSGLAEAAKPIAAAANRLANRVMPSQRGPGIEVQRDGREVYVVNTDHGAHLDEWGSINNPPNAPLRRGAREAGARVREK